MLLTLRTDVEGGDAATQERAVQTKGAYCDPSVMSHWKAHSILEHDVKFLRSICSQADRPEDAFQIAQAVWESELGMWAFF